MDYSALKSDNYPRQEVDWNDIGDLIRRWAKKHPEKFKENMKWVASTKEGMYDKKFGLMGGPDDSTKVGGGGTRLGIVIHPDLLNYIETMYPKFMQEKGHVTTFRKKFPRFQVTESW